MNDAYEVLGAIAAHSQGRAAFVANRGVHSLCDVCVRQTFQCEKALALLLRLLQVTRILPNFDYSE